MRMQIFVAMSIRVRGAPLQLENEIAHLHEKEIWRNYNRGPIWLPDFFKGVSYLCESGKH